MKNTLNLLMLNLLLSLISMFVFAQAPAAGKSDFGLPAESMHFPEYEQHGQLLTIKLIPSKKETRIYLVGKEAASISVDKYTVHAQVLMGRHRQDITFKKENDYFATDEKIKGDMLQLKFEENESKKTEEFKFKLRKQ